MARITKGNKAREHAQIREQLTSKLEEFQDSYRIQHENAVREHLESQKVKEVEEYSTDKKPVNPTKDQNVGEFKEVKEMQNFENFDMNQFGNPQTEVDPMQGIHFQNDGNVEQAPDAATETEGKGKRKSSEEFDLTEVCEEALKGTFTNLQEKAVSVKKILTDNLAVKQFITASDFGRGLELVKQKITDGDILCHFAVKTIKPGRAKSVVVSVPRVIADLFEQTRRKSPKGVMNAVADSFENGQLTDEQKADRVDLVMNYDDFCIKVANLMEGVVAEFGGVGGVLDTDVAKTAYKAERPDKDGKVNFVAKDLDAGTIKEVIGGKTHVLYQMVQPKKEYLKKLAQNSAEMNKAELDAINRWKNGKSALKRTKGAFSVLYTPENYTSAIQFETVKPFGKTPLTAEQAKALSAKAAFAKNNNKFGEGSELRLDSYDAQGFNGDVFKAFDPSVKADARYEILTVAKDYAKKGKDGKVLTQKIWTEVKKEDGTVKREQVPTEIKAAKFTLVDRLPKNFFTGQVLEGAELENAEFVTYGSSYTNKQNKMVAPPTLKKRISFDGLEAEVNERRGIVGTFGLEDESVSKLIKLTSEEVAKNAFISAFSRTSSGRTKNEVSEYEDGTVSALMMAIDL